jgi:hypothetical protein
MNRRVFLKSGAMAMLSLGFAPSFLGRAAAAASARRKLLIAIFQRGAVDGLNMVVPYGEADYYRMRPTIAIPRDAVVDWRVLGRVFQMLMVYNSESNQSEITVPIDQATTGVFKITSVPIVAGNNFDGKMAMRKA